MAELIHLGRTRYREALAQMREIHARVARDEAPETWLFTEHEPVITLGRNAKREHVHLSDAALAARGIDLVEVERGGDATYHGPGQIVVYPIRKLERFREVSPLVGALERAVVAALGTFGIAAQPRPEHRGVYVGENAICAIGLAVKQMTSLHGLALNISTELDYDRLILPCGTPEFGITSIARELGRAVAMQTAADVLIAALAGEFGLTFERAFEQRALHASESNSPAS
jgi:lipoate-protein ligase B